MEDILPIRCFNCGNPIAGLGETFQSFNSDPVSVEKAWKSLYHNDYLNYMQLIGNEESDKVMENMGYAEYIDRFNELKTEGIFVKGYGNGPFNIPQIFEIIHNVDKFNKLQSFYQKYKSYPEALRAMGYGVRSRKEVEKEREYEEKIEKGKDVEEERREIIRDPPKEIRVRIDKKKKIDIEPVEPLSGKTSVDIRNEINDIRKFMAKSHRPVGNVEAMKLMRLHKKTILEDYKRIYNSLVERLGDESNINIQKTVFQKLGLLHRYSEFESLSNGDNIEETFNEMGLNKTRYDIISEHVDIEKIKADSKEMWRAFTFAGINTVVYNYFVFLAIRPQNPLNTFQILNIQRECCRSSLKNPAKIPIVRFRQIEDENEPIDINVLVYEKNISEGSGKAAISMRGKNVQKPTSKSRTSELILAKKKRAIRRIKKLRRRKK